MLKTSLLEASGPKRFWMAVLLMLACAGVAGAQSPIYVELKSPPPVAVARYEAAQAGQPFDAALHRAAIRLAQDKFLSQLTGAGVLYTLTSTTTIVGSNPVTLPDRYSELINAVRLQVTANDVGKVRANPNVKHISVDTPRYLFLNNSTPYIRANGPDSARTRGIRGTGSVNADGSSSGQVIAVLDTGVDSTNPMFDSRFPDAQFAQRSGDLRPVRLQGTPFNPLLHHAKVIYRALFSSQHVAGDDNGHGTQSASTAAGLMAQTDAGEIIEGVAPGAPVMDYKICPSLVCEEQLILMSLEDAARDRDLAGFPKPRATVVNMSFGDCTGNPYSADAIAAGNLTFLGVVPQASAGNLDSIRAALCDDHDENTIGSPAAGRLVIASGATVDPGNAPNTIDVLEADRVTVRPGTPKIQSVFAPESNGAQKFTTAITQNYVYGGFGDTPADIPDGASGRICLVQRGTTPFAVKATNCTAKGAVAVIIFNNVPGPIGVATAPAVLPVFTISQEDGLFLKDSLGFDAAGVSNLPIRINLEDPALFVADVVAFSARGPNNDFLVVKPDVTAPGTEILMGTALAGSPTHFTSASGTSFSGPHISGAAALVRDPAAGRPDFSPSMVRAALMNSATNVRERDNVTPIPDNDDRNLILKTGAGLVEMVRATSVKALMGTNELNGTSGPDQPEHPDFLPSYSFAVRRWVGTNLPAVDANQRASITVTLADVSGLGGSYNLSLVEGGALRGDITRPITATGFSVALGQSSATIPANGRATFTVHVAGDGTASGVQLAGADDDGLEGTDFMWFVVATPTGGSESLRMPMYLRVAQGVPGGGPVGSTNGKGCIGFTEGSDDPCGKDRNGHAEFKFSAEASSPPRGEIRYTEPGGGITLNGVANSVSTSSTTAAFSGSCTLKDGTACSYIVDVEDNAEPGKGADRFTIRWTTSSGQTTQRSGILRGGNIRVSNQ